MNHQLPRSEKGLTLIELLISLVLGVILLIFFVQTFVANKENYRIQTNLSRMQEDARYALTLMARQIAMAGFRSDPTSSLLAVFGNDVGGEAQVVNDPGVSGDPATATDTAGGDPAYGSYVIDGSDDSITVRYQGNSQFNIRDCADNIIGDGVVVTETFFIGNNDLICRTDDGASESFTTIIENADALQIQYRIMRNAGGTVTSGYYSGSNVAAADWPYVAGAKISLVVASNEQHLALSPENPALPNEGDTNYQLYSSSTAAESSYPTLRLRRVYRTVVAMRNVIRDD